MRWAAERLVVGGRDQAGHHSLADEPQWLARHLAGVPVVVGARRRRTARVACDEFQADVLVLDDGFQHRQLHRDCDIVLVRARTPFDGGRLFPRGPMREPLASLRRADVILVTKADEALGTLAALRERLQAIAPAALVVTAVHAPSTLTDGISGAVSAPQRVRGLRVGMCSSIGDPDGFEETLRRLEAVIAWHARFPDHHAYRQDDWARLVQRMTRERPEALVTTEKDWVRLQPIVSAGLPSPVPVWVLGVQMTILDGAQELHDRLARVSAR